MNKSVAELIAALAEKGSVLRELKALCQREQSCLTALDLASMDENEEEMAAAMDRLARLSERCRQLIGALGSELGLSGNQTLSPVIARLPQPEQLALREAQATVNADARALNGLLTMNRGLLEESLKFVQQSVNFFNRLFNPGDTYGMGGSLVSRRGGSRFVCKEV